MPLTGHHGTTRGHVLPRRLLYRKVRKMRRQDDLLNSAPVAILIYWACGVWPMGRTGYGIERVRGGHALGSSVLPTDVEISRLSKPRASPGRQPAARLARMRVPPSRLWVDGRSRQPARSPRRVLETVTSAVGERPALFRTLRSTPVECTQPSTTGTQPPVECAQRGGLSVVECPR